MSADEKRFRVMSANDAAKAGHLDEEWLDEWCWFLLEFLPGQPVRIVGRDGGEPEDQLLVRDWRWVVVELNKLADELEAK